MRKIRINMFFIVAVILSSITACTHKDIVYPGSGTYEINIKFMWDSAYTKLPGGMTLYFFPLWGDGKVWRYDISGHEGGSVELPAGSYSMIAYNNDLPGVTVSGFSSLSECMASAITSKGVIVGTGPFYSASVPRIDVTMCGVDYSDCDGHDKECPMGLVRCYPQRRYCNYKVILKNIKGIEHVSKATVLLGGMAENVNLASGDLSLAALPLSVDMKKNDQADGFAGASTSFGLCGSDTNIVADLQVMLIDGTVIKKTFDVTSQVLNAPDPKDVVVVIEGIDIPSSGTPPSDGDVGMDVGVEGWIVVNIDIIKLLVL